MVAHCRRHAHRIVVTHSGPLVDHVREQRDQRMRVLELVRDLARVGVELPEDEAKGPLGIRGAYTLYADAAGPIWSRSLYENVVLLCIVYVVKETTLPLWVDDL